MHVWQFPLLAAVLVLSGCCSLAHAYQNGTLAAASPGTADKQYPQLSEEIKYTKLFAPSLDAYVNDPKTACTIIAPDNDAIKLTMQTLGQYVGLFLQNKTMQEQVLSYHVIPGSRIKAEDLGTKVTSVLTKANQTLWFVNRNGQPYATFRPDYVVPLQIVNIKAGGCLMHIVHDLLLVPPTLMPTFEGWQKAAGTKSLAAPESQWAPAMPPAPGAIEAPAQAQDMPEALPSAAAAKDGSSAAAAPAAAASGAGSWAGARGGGAVLAGMVAAALMMV